MVLPTWHTQTFAVAILGYAVLATVLEMLKPSGKQVVGCPLKFLKQCTILMVKRAKCRCYLKYNEPKGRQVIIKKLFMCISESGWNRDASKAAEKQSQD